jgi:hypothetical protein
MVTPEKLPAALYAVHSVLVRLRFLAGEGIEASELYKILDAAEVLPCLIGERPEDTTEEFRAALQGLSEQYPSLAGLDRDFDNDVAWIAPAAQ